MGNRSSRSPLLVALLVLHLGHAPVPVWDGDDRPSGAPPLAAVCPDDVWDLDLLLLGARPPQDPDDGPFDGTPPCPGQTPFGAPCGIHVALADAPLLHPTALPSGRESPAPVRPRAAQARPPGEPLSFAVTYARPGDWRTRLAVILV